MTRRTRTRWRAGGGGGVTGEGRLGADGVMAGTGGNIEGHIECVNLLNANVCGLSAGGAVDLNSTAQ